jgi:hypothetical protein
MPEAANTLYLMTDQQKVSAASFLENLLIFSPFMDKMPKRAIRMIDQYVLYAQILLSDH